MSISVVDGFLITNASPIDSRSVAADLSSRNAIPSSYRFIGFPAYVVSENKNYRLVGGITNSDWQEENSDSASYAYTSSWAINALNGGTTLVSGSLYDITASWSRSSSYSILALTADFALLAGTSITATTASHVLTASVSILALTASLVTSASYSITSSYAINAGGGGTTLVSGSTYNITSSWANNAKTASNLTPAITNNVNDYILTATGTGTINGESVLIASTNGLTINAVAGNPIINFQSASTNLAIIRVDTSSMYMEIGDLYTADPKIGMKLYTNNVVRMTISSSGDVGIGTTNPTTTLDVNGNVKATSFTGSLKGTSSWAENSKTASYIGSGVNNYIPKWNNNTLTSASLIIDDGTTVGIGTSNLNSLVKLYLWDTHNVFGEKALKIVTDLVSSGSTGNDDGILSEYFIHAPLSSSAVVSAIHGQMALENSASNTLMTAVRGTVAFTGSRITGSNLAGLYSFIFSVPSSSFNVDSLYSIQTQTQFEVPYNSTINNMFGMAVCSLSTINNTGSISASNAFGVHISPQKIQENTVYVTNGYGVYQNGPNDYNYFAGNVGIGTTNPNTFSLQVAGNIGPNADNTYDLGSPTKRWKTLYAVTFESSGSVSSASYALTASLLIGNVVSASYSTTSSYALTGGGSGTTLTTSSTYPITSSWAITSSYLLGSVTSASYALSASYAPPGNSAVTASYALTSSTLVGQNTNTLWIPAAAMITNTTSGSTYGTLEYGTEKVMIGYQSFDQLGQKSSQFAVSMPKTWDVGTVSGYFVFTTAYTGSSSTGSVVWALGGGSTGYGDNLNITFGTTQSVAASTGIGNAYTASYFHYTSSNLSPVTIGGTPQAEDTIWFKIYRNALHPNDTLSGSAALIGLKLLIGTTGFGDQ